MSTSKVYNVQDARNVRTSCAHTFTRCGDGGAAEDVTFPSQPYTTLRLVLSAKFDGRAHGTNTARVDDVHSEFGCDGEANEEAFVAELACMAHALEPRRHFFAALQCESRQGCAQCVRRGLLCAPIRVPHAFEVLIVAQGVAHELA